MAPMPLVSPRMGFASICGTLDAFSNLGGYQTSTYELSGLGTPAQINAARLTAKHVSRAQRPALDGPRLHAAGRRRRPAGGSA